MAENARNLLTFLAQAVHMQFHALGRLCTKQPPIIDFQFTIVRIDDLIVIRAQLTPETIIFRSFQMHPTVALARLQIVAFDRPVHIHRVEVVSDECAADVWNAIGERNIRVNVITAQRKYGKLGLLPSGYIAILWRF